MKLLNKLFCKFKKCQTRRAELKKKRVKNNKQEYQCTIFGVKK